MTILITGGSGYIGERLTEFLAADENNKIIVAARRLPTHPQTADNVGFVESDWNSPVCFQQLMKGVDVVVHLAGMNAIESSNDPEKAIAFKRDATSILLRAAIDNQVRHVLYFSSAHVYASPLAGHIDENTIPVSTHPYALAHLAAEELVLATDAQGLLRGTVIRLSNTFGRPASKEVNCWMLLVNDLCRQAVTGQRMVLKSTGLQRRDFVSMTDVCRAARYLMDVPPVTGSHPIFNVGGNWAPTIWEMACLIQKRCGEILGFTPTLERIEPDPTDQPGYLEYSIDRLLNTGFVLKSNAIEEIDQLLYFCKHSFSHT
jgi:UDP-glucose 4-epimerase